jgi:hypothetical protein
MSGGLDPRSRGRSAVMLGVGAGGVRGITPEKFRNFTCKILNFGAHLGKIISLFCWLLFVNF